jgi:hypothetical protein
LIVAFSILCSAVLDCRTVLFKEEKKVNYRMSCYFLCPFHGLSSKLFFFQILYLFIYMCSVPYSVVKKSSFFCEKSGRNLHTSLYYSSLIKVDRKNQILLPLLLHTNKQIFFFCKFIVAGRCVMMPKEEASLVKINLKKLFLGFCMPVIYILLKRVAKDCLPIFHFCDVILIIYSFVRTY